MQTISEESPEETFRCQKGLNALFYMDDEVGKEFHGLLADNDAEIGLLDEFDRLPAKIRAEIATAVVEGYIATGDVRWSEALAGHVAVKRVAMKLRA